MLLPLLSLLLTPATTIDSNYNVTGIQSITIIGQAYANGSAQTNITGISQLPSLGNSSIAGSSNTNISGTISNSAHNTVTTVGSSVYGTTGIIINTSLGTVTISGLANTSTTGAIVSTSFGDELAYGDAQKDIDGEILTADSFSVVYFLTTADINITSGSIEYTSFGQAIAESTTDCSAIGIEIQSYTGNSAVLADATLDIVIGNQVETAAGNVMTYVTTTYNAIGVGATISTGTANFITSALFTTSGTADTVSYGNVIATAGSRAAIGSTTLVSSNGTVTLSASSNYFIAGIVSNVLTGEGRVVISANAPGYIISSFIGTQVVSASSNVNTVIGLIVPSFDGNEKVTTGATVFIKGVGYTTESNKVGLSNNYYPYPIVGEVFSIQEFVKPIVIVESIENIRVDISIVPTTIMENIVTTIINVDVMDKADVKVL